MIEAFGSDKADVIYDCAGNNITMGQAIKYARKWKHDRTGGCFSQEWQK